MEGNEMELSLELTIGGCYYKNIEKSRNHENGNNKKINEIDENNSLVSQSYVVGYLQDDIFSSESGKKREIQALRRREAMKKREEKQRRWARSRGVNERIHMEMQENQARGMGRKWGECESSEEFFMKRAKAKGNSKAESSSTDAGSHSNNSLGAQQQMSTTATSTTSDRSDLNGPSSLLQPNQAKGKDEKVFPTVSFPNIPTHECSNTRRSEPINKPIPTLNEQNSSGSRQCNEAVIKQSKPHSNNQDTNALPRMPLVSTTGNGPDGKTVNGFLYSYSKTEVNIVCVCHGSSFSPAKFVEHAGGIDISHPLKHITIVPTPFG